jgi:NADH:ubiquinone oxidoreductase subunit 6 (subunit J)
MPSTVLFYLFAGLAIASAISMVYHKTCSIASRCRRIFSLSCIYISLAAQFGCGGADVYLCGASFWLFSSSLLNLEKLTNA